eukprot:CAMPEP_0201585578 /NCGR_PEP_ID=MMETSP0190_2-20130828/123598_1 /ASSEMBLY_ACC=CAM_ASM_000263 /TAXON_ID=37353 /ORGANISM="Rosalina sp." /LENGTH=48 /DNA_ID= /DNA_START= /DNA_END= /DNA_ORIENTATION=
MISGFVVYRPSENTVEGEAGGFIAGIGAFIFGMALMIGTCVEADPDEA